MRFRSSFPFRSPSPITPPAQLPNSSTPAEPTIRRVVAERLGVGADDLDAGVSLRDDLAADSLDLVELMLALEAELAIEVPDGVAVRVRTYGELVIAIAGLLTDGHHPPAREAA